MHVLGLVLYGRSSPFHGLFRRRWWCVGRCAWTKRLVWRNRLLTRNQEALHLLPRRVGSATRTCCGITSIAPTGIPLRHPPSPLGLPFILNERGVSKLNNLSFVRGERVSILGASPSFWSMCFQLPRTGNREIRCNCICQRIGSMLYLLFCMYMPPSIHGRKLAGDW